MVAILADITVSVNVAPQARPTPVTTPTATVPGGPRPELPRTGLGEAAELLLLALLLVCLGTAVVRAVRRPTI